MAASLARQLWWPLRLALSRGALRWGDEQQLRLRQAAGGGEGDMHADAAERMYGALYLHHLRGLIGERRGLRILDVGCQSGRLAVPLAADGHEVTAFDLSAGWLARCQAHAQASGVTLRLVQGAAGDAPALLGPQRFDLVVCTELLYALPDPSAVLQGLRGLAAAGGSLVSSHRTRHYMLLTLARFHRWDDVATVAAAEQGEIFDGQHYSWTDADGLRALYARAGWRIAQMHGIGCLSGVGVDGLAGVLDASALNDAALARLLPLELACGARYPDAARYRLLIAHAD